MIINKTLSVEQVVVAVIMGSLLFSPIGANSILVLGGNFYPEFAVFALLAWGVIRCRSMIRIGYKIISSRLFLVWLILSLICFCLGFFYQHGSIPESYSSLRGFMIFIFGYCLVKQVSGSSGSYKAASSLIVILALSAIISTIFYYSQMQFWSIKRPYSIPALLCVLMIASQYRRASILFFAIILSLYCGFTSGFRAFILYSVIGSIAAFLHFNANQNNAFFKLDRQNRNRIVYSLVIVIFVFSLLPFGYDYFISWVNADPSRYHQIVYKFQYQYDELISGQLDVNSEPRLLFAVSLIDNLLYYFFPSGFYDRGIYQMFSIWGGDRIYTFGSSPIKDGGYLFMSMSFGVFITCLSVSICLYKFLKMVFVCPGLNSVAYVFYGAVVFMLFMTMGNIFLVIGVSFFYGVILSMLLKRL